MDTQRLILLFVFGFSVLMLWEAWQKENRPKPAPTAQQAAPAPQNSAGAAKPAAGAPSAAAPAAAVPGTAGAAPQGETLHVRTDLFVGEIDTLGGTLKRLE